MFSRSILSWHRFARLLSVKYTLRRAQENLVAVALLAVFAGVIWLCQDFGPRTRMIPLPLAIAGIVLTVIRLICQNLRSTDELPMHMINVRASGMVDGGEPTAHAPAAGADGAELSPNYLAPLRQGALVRSFGRDG